MDYEMDLHLPARPDHAVLVARLLAELEAVPGGPGTEVARLAAALQPVVRALLHGLERAGGGGLDLHLEADDVRVRLELAAAPAVGEPPGSLLGDDEPALVAALSKAFDEVESRQAGGGRLRLSLTRHIPC